MMWTSDEKASVWLAKMIMGALQLLLDEQQAGLVVKVTLATGARMPERANDGDSGLDLFALLDGPVTIGSGRSRRIDTGVHLELPRGYEAQVRPRSGMASNGVLSALGTIDEGYRGPVGVILFNHGPEAVTVAAGQKIAQLVIAPVANRCSLELVEELSETERGAKGFGSSGQ